MNIKSLHLITLAVLAAAVVGYCADSDKQKTDSNEKSSPEVLSEQQISQLKKTFTDPKTEKKYVWKGKFQKNKRSQANLKKKIAYRITGALYEVKSVGNREVYARQSGECHIFIKDSEGKTITQTTKKLDSMCPS